MPYFAQLITGDYSYSVSVAFSTLLLPLMENKEKTNIMNRNIDCFHHFIFEIFFIFQINLSKPSENDVSKPIEDGEDIAVSNAIMSE